MIPQGLISHQPGLKINGVPLHLHQKAKTTSSLQMMLLLLDLTGHEIISDSNRLHHFLEEDSTDYWGFKFKQTTKEGKH